MAGQMNLEQRADAAYSAEMERHARYERDPLAEAKDAAVSAVLELLGEEVQPDKVTAYRDRMMAYVRMQVGAATTLEYRCQLADAVYRNDAGEGLFLIRECVNKGQTFGEGDRTYTCNRDSQEKVTDLLHLGQRRSEPAFCEGCKTNTPNGIEWFRGPRRGWSKAAYQERARVF